MEEPGFRLPGRLVVAPLAIAFCLWLLFTRTFNQAWILVALMRRLGGRLLCWRASQARLT